jgi:hypothetical protein
VFNSIKCTSNKGRGGWKTIGQSLDLIALFFGGCRIPTSLTDELFLLQALHVRLYTST